MTTRHLISILAATGAIAAASPALSQPQRPYEEGARTLVRAAESVSPVPAAPDPLRPILRRAQPVVSQIPATRMEAGADGVVPNTYRIPALPQQPTAAQQVAYPQNAAPRPNTSQASRWPVMEENAWMAECRRQQQRNNDKNREVRNAAEAAKAAAGNAVDNVPPRSASKITSEIASEAEDYCKRHLTRYTTIEGQRNYARANGQENIVWVRTMVQVPQRRVTRERVTYEIVNESEDAPAQRRLAQRSIKQAPNRTQMPDDGTQVPDGTQQPVLYAQGN